jgi:hypothetical protein
MDLPHPDRLVENATAPSAGGSPIPISISIPIPIKKVI